MADAFVPPGWDYNPSAWSQRLPPLGLAAAGLVIAAYLASYQFGLVGGIWDPFFERGSELVLTSSLSRALPVPDAALGALGYLLDLVSGLIGGRDRWRTMPWIVILFGLAVGPLGAVSILLVIAQPLLVQNWCTLCLASAVLSLSMIGPSMDEVLASLQALKRANAAGRSMWRAFWGLGEAPDAGSGGRRASRAGRG